MSDALKIVVDTQIFLRAFIKPVSASGRLFSEWFEYYILYLCDEIEAEIRDVLNRREIRIQFPQITNEKVKASEAIFAKAVRVEVKLEDVEPICRDPKDDVFLACAKVGNAAYLVTEDKDLLVLKKHYTTQIVNLGTFLSILEQRKNLSPDE